MSAEMQLHSLPFSIGYNGAAEVDQAFPVVLNNESNTFQSTFRGRKLIGRSHELPHSLSGKTFYIRFPILIHI